MKIENVLVGPFLGDYKTEIIDFRPYVRWIYEAIKPEKMFVATHSNREFLYDWATVIPVFEDLSRDELNQSGFIHNSISQKDLNIVIKKVKSNIFKRRYPSKDLVHLSVLYSKGLHWFPLYKRMYTPIKFKKKKSDMIIFIPCINEKYAVIKEIYDHLLDKFGDRVIVAGDMKIHLHEKNIMLRNPTYFKDVYYDITKLITNARAVITPTSQWTILSLLQGTPVFSWGCSPEYFMNDTKHRFLHNNVSGANLKMMAEEFINSIKN